MIGSAVSGTNNQIALREGFLMREAPLQLDLQYIALLLTALGESRKVFEREHMLVLNEHRSSCGWHCIPSQTCEPGLTVWCDTGHRTERFLFVGDR